MKKLVAIILLLGLTGYGIWQALAAGQSKEVGLSVRDTAPDFALKTIDGQSIHLSDFRGKPVIVNFWTTWCPPCREEMPAMQKFYQEYKNEVQLLAVHLTSQDERQKVEPFIQKYGITFPVVLDEKGKILKLYNIQTLPTSYLIDSNGVIRKKIVGPMTYKQMVEITAKLR
ncbi:TlpA disulfide reductase family protein [Thermaerobacillus caldiproteolyticus]|uniref:TlpA disulfide reductase family protein n=1 Tax=Thermaerobacillus caldiproteolyticus TaxID=247480 RepID=UPI00188A2991|nr:TlpA disulfide reductase family protein [Anoxybacillus caldiproteolyticus]QPA32722.1 TlpA family protein disulfide reductase [Anoxybacillus caldiproteolyticus]